MMICFDSRGPIFNFRDPNWVPETPQKNLLQRHQLQQKQKNIKNGNHFNNLSVQVLSIVTLLLELTFIIKGNL